jgi:hypothetical protein
VKSENKSSNRSNKIVIKKTSTTTITTNRSSIILTSSGVKTIVGKYNRRNNPELEKRRIHHCDFMGEFSGLTDANCHQDIDTSTLPMRAQIIVATFIFSRSNISSLIDRNYRNSLRSINAASECETMSGDGAATATARANWRYLNLLAALLMLFS